MRRRPLLPGLGLLALLWALVGPALTPVDGPDRTLCLTVLDVGQGDALLLDLPGAVWLVDGGGAPGSRRDVGESVVVPALRRRGVDRLDRVVLTHGDGDHIGGLFAVLEQLDVAELLVPTRRRLSSAERMLLALAQRQGTEVLVADEGAPLGPLPGGAHGALLHPRPDWEPPDPDDRNAGSVVFDVGLGGVDFLLTGDIEAETEELLAAQGRVPRVAVLKLAHHGSRTSTTEAFLSRAAPLVAVAGAGRDNRFGFPHASVTGRLTEQGVPLYWTGRHGEVRVCTDGFEVSVAGGEQGALVRTFDAAEVASWRSELPVPVPVSPGLAADDERPKESKPRRRRPRRRSRKKAAKAAAEPEVEEAPQLLDDRSWRRRRKSAAMKAPWKGRR